MSEKGILMNGAMVRAIMAGKKTQTRRIMRNQPRNGIRKCPWYPSGLEDMHGYQVKKLYWPGDHLYVRETWMIAGFYKGEANRPVIWIPDDQYCGYREPDHWYGYVYRADGGLDVSGPDGYEERENGDARSYWSPSIHMPKSAARIWLEVVCVWPEIVENISEADARAEGFDSKKDFLDTMVKIYGDCLKKWCWATEFKRIEVGK